MLAGQGKDFTHEEKAVAAVLGIAEVLELVHSRTLIEIHVAGRFSIVVKGTLERFATTLDSTAQEMLEHVISTISGFKYALFV